MPSTSCDRRSCTIVVLIGALAAPLTHAQENLISPAVSDADWRATELVEGVVWRTHHFDDLLGLPQFVSVLDVDLEAPGIRVDVVDVDSGFARTSGLGRMVGAIAAINGSYFEPDGTSSMFLQEDGTVVKADDDGEARIWEEGAVVTEVGGDAGVIRRSGMVWQAIDVYSDVLVSGPLLVWDGELQESAAVGFNLTHHPRTAVGLTADNHLILLTADGRNPQSAGMTMQELALVMQALGCETALNLDGGGSTTMWIDGKGVVNHPSDNGAFDHLGERLVSNAVVIVVRG